MMPRTRVHSQLLLVAETHCNTTTLPRGVLQQLGAKGSKHPKHL
jgi:hypothetical protein